MSRGCFCGALDRRGFHPDHSFGPDKPSLVGRRSEAIETREDCDAEDTLGARRLRKLEVDGVEMISPEAAPNTRQQNSPNTKSRMETPFIETLSQITGE